MKYNTTNMTVSLVKACAAYLQSKGFDVLWHSTGVMDSRVGGSPNMGTITFVSAYPAVPRFISRLKGESAGETDLAVPALALYTASGPAKIRSQGLGHNDSEWARAFTIEAVTETDEQQRTLMDLLHEWLMDVPHVAIPCYDYSAPLAPVLLAPVYVDEANVDSIMVPQPFDAAKYIVRVDGAVTYFE